MCMQRGKKCEVDDKSWSGRGQFRILFRIHGALLTKQEKCAALFFVEIQIISSLAFLFSVGASVLKREME